MKRILLLIALAGCLGSPSTGPEADASAPEYQAPANITQVLLGVEAFEPTLGITPDGTAYYRAGSAPGSQDPGLIMVSTDGTNWTSTSPNIAGVSTLAISFDPFLHVDPTNGRVYALDLVGLACATLNSSDDGETWRSNPLACGQPGVHDQPSLITVDHSLALDGRAVVYCATRIIDAVCAVSLDGGQTFGPLTEAFLPKPLTEADRIGYCAAPTGRVAAAAGTLWLPADRCGEPAVAVSQDGGVTWTETVVGPDVEGQNDPELAARGADDALAVWTGADGLPRMAVYDGTWQPPESFAPANVTAVDFVTAAAHADGYVVAYMATTDASYQDLDGDGIAAEVGDASWDLMVTFVGDSVRHHEVHPDLVVGECGRNRCPGIYDFMDIQVGPDGRAWVAYVIPHDRDDASQWEAAVAIIDLEA